MRVPWLHHTRPGSIDTRIYVGPAQTVDSRWRNDQRRAGPVCKPVQRILNPALLNFFASQARLVASSSNRYRCIAANNGPRNRQTRWRARTDSENPAGRVPSVFQTLPRQGLGRKSATLCGQPGKGSLPNSVSVKNSCVGLPGNALSRAQRVSFVAGSFHHNRYSAPAVVLAESTG